MKITELLEKLNAIAPFCEAEEYDNSGLIISSEENINGILICLDATLDNLKIAVQNNINTVLSHHPLIFKSLRNLDNIKDEEIVFALKNNMNIISFHTNADAQFMGTALAEKSGFYDIEKVDKYKVTARCDRTTVGEFKKKIKDIDKNTKSVYKDANKEFEKVLIYTGAGGRDESIIDTALDYRVDGIITAELKHSIALTALKRNIAIFEVGHFESEIHFVDFMKKELSNLNIKILPVYSGSVYND